MTQRRLAMHLDDARRFCRCALRRYRRSAGGFGSVRLERRLRFGWPRRRLRLGTGNGRLLRNRSCRRRRRACGLAAGVFVVEVLRVRDNRSRCRCRRFARCRALAATATTATAATARAHLVTRRAFDQCRVERRCGKCRRRFLGCSGGRLCIRSCRRRRRRVRDGCNRLRLWLALRTLLRLRCRTRYYRRLLARRASRTLVAPLRIVACRLFCGLTLSTARLGRSRVATVAGLCFPLRSL